MKKMCYTPRASAEGWQLLLNQQFSFELWVVVEAEVEAEIDIVRGGSGLVPLYLPTTINDESAAMHTTKTEQGIKCM